jgi:hypothetical protein
MVQAEFMILGGNNFRVCAADDPVAREWWLIWKIRADQWDSTCCFSTLAEAHNTAHNWLPDHVEVAYAPALLAGTWIDRMLPVMTTPP